MTHIFSNPLFYKKRSGITEEIIHGVYYFYESGQPAYGENFPVISSTLFNLLKFIALEIDVSFPGVMAAMAARPGKDSRYFDIVKDMADLYQVKESDLICSRYRSENSEELSRFYNPYALQHVIVVGACKQNGIDPDKYWEEDHPIQERIFSVVGKATSEPTSWCTGVSGLPAAITSAKTLLKVWSELSESGSPVVESFFSSLKQDPSSIIQNNQFEYQVMAAFKGRLMVLSNDSGVFLVKSVDAGDKDFGFLVKFASNADRKYAPYGLLAALKNYPYENSLVLELRDYLEARVSGAYQNGVEVSFP